MVQVTLGDILTQTEWERAQVLYRDLKDTGFARQVATELIEPNIERINRKTGQQNDPLYLAYLVEYVLSIHWQD